MKLDWRTLRIVLAVLCLLALSVSGLWGLEQEWRHSDTIGRIFSAGVQTLYSLLGLVACVALYRRWRWTRGLLWAWAGALFLTGATAPVIWGEQGWLAGVFAASMTLACAAIVIALAWDRSRR